MANQQIVLLMSVDIIGSTSFKANRGSHAWIPAIEAFFDLVIREVLSATNRVRSPRLGFLGLGQMPRVGVHKVKGDEVLFTCWPETMRDVADTLGQFNKAVAKLHGSFMAQHGLGVHATAWTAGMAIRNRAIRIQHLDADGIAYFEYVGPDVDIGFRLEEYAPPGRVIVPHELPPVLSELGMEFERIGETRLKGVPVDPYPLWLIAGDAQQGREAVDAAAQQVLKDWG